MATWSRLMDQGAISKHPPIQKVVKYGSGSNLVKVGGIRNVACETGI